MCQMAAIERSLPFFGCGRLLLPFLTVNLPGSLVDGQIGCHGKLQGQMLPGVPVQVPGNGQAAQLLEMLQSIPGGSIQNSRNGRGGDAVVVVAQNG